METNLVGPDNTSVLQPDAVSLFVFELKAYNNDPCLNEQDLIDIFVFPEVNGVFQLNSWLQICKNLNHELLVEFVIPAIISLEDRTVWLHNYLWNIEVLNSVDFQKVLKKEISVKPTDDFMGQLLQ